MSSALVCKLWRTTTLLPLRNSRSEKQKEGPRAKGGRTPKWGENRPTQKKSRARPRDPKQAATGPPTQSQRNAQGESSESQKHSKEENKQSGQPEQKRTNRTRSLLTNSSPDGFLGCVSQCPSVHSTQRKGYEKPLKVQWHPDTTQLSEQSVSRTRM